jgi:hypothetical protein
VTLVNEGETNISQRKSTPIYERDIHVKTQRRLCNEHMFESVVIVLAQRGREKRKRDRREQREK